MKKASLYEAAAMAIAVIGAFLFAGGLMPFTNPGAVEMHNEGTYSPRMQFLIPTLLSLPVLGCAWRLNQKAQRIRRSDATSIQNKPFTLPK
jgi:hypothetical protein